MMFFRNILKDKKKRKLFVFIAGKRANSGVDPGDNWLLTGGVWADSGEWVDGNVWID